MVRADWTALPIVIFAMSLVAGEAFGFAFHMFAGMWGWTILLTVLVGSVAFGWGVTGVMYPIVFLSGVALAWRVECGRIAIEEYAKTLTAEGHAPEFVLRVVGDAERRRNKRGRFTVGFASTVGSLPVKVVAPLSVGGTVPADGELWRCRGWLSLRKNSASRYSRRMLWVTDRYPMEKVGESCRWSAVRLYRRLSLALSRRMAEGVGWSREIVAFGNAMLLGRRDGIPYGRLGVFAAAGTIHVFAISGLHVMLVAGLLNGLLKLLGLSVRMRAACAIPCLAAYVMLIGSPPSAVRAALMTSMYFAACFFGRKPDSLAAWGAAVILICGISPEKILDVGCVLSFTVMLGIVLWIRWSRRFASPADGLLELASRESALGCGWRKSVYLWLYGKASWLLGGLGISFAAWIAGTPVAAVVFGRLTLVGVLTNVAVIPLAGMAVTFGVFGLLSSAVLPYLGMLFNNMSGACIFLMAELSEMTAAIPHSSVETMPWSWLDCVMWYVAWIGLFALLSRHLPGKRYVSVKEWENDDDQKND